MNNILPIISKYGDGVIIILGIVLLIFMIRNFIKLSAQKDRIEDLLERRNKKYKKNKDTHELEEEDDESASITPDTIRSCEKKFNELCSLHSVFAQLIPLFPQLGILGTVAGLMLAVQTGDTEKIMSALGTALSTTILGLLFAIILKAFDTFPSKTINDVEVMLDNFDKKLELANMYDDIKKK